MNQIKSCGGKNKFTPIVKPNLNAIMKSGGKNKPRKLKPGFSCVQGQYYRTVMYGGILRRVLVIFKEN